MSPEDSTLLFHFPPRGGPAALRKIRRRELKRFLGDVAARAIHGRAVSCLITNDPELQRLNRDFRGKDSATDVLSFPSGGANGFAGDIAISLDRAIAQAAECGHEVDEELRILILHGVLHLSGLDHESDSGEMAKAERMWRRRLGLSAGLIDRTNTRENVATSRARTDGAIQAASEKTAPSRSIRKRARP